MIEEINLVGRILIAMPQLKDPNFERSVVLVCAHSAEGALGLVVNRPHGATMDSVISQLGLAWRRERKPVLHSGGPVAPERGFILHERDYDLPGRVRVVSDLYMGTNPDILHSIAQDEQEGRFLLALGYTGWGDGQLEMEIRESSWLVAELDRSLLFDVPLAERWQVAIRQLKVDPAQLVASGRAVN